MKNRKRLRLQNYDYTSEGCYYVTICTQNHISLFSKIVNDKILLNNYGDIVDKCWIELNKYDNQIKTDYYVIMPNHFHGILFLSGKNEGGKSLSDIMAYFKYKSTKMINELRNTPSVKIWQRSFYDRIIKNEKELFNARKYIQENPLRKNLNEERL